MLQKVIVAAAIACAASFASAANPQVEFDTTAGIIKIELFPEAAPKTVEVKLTKMHGGKPWMTSFDNRFVQAAARAIELGFRERPVFNREGGSIPVVSTFSEELGVAPLTETTALYRRIRADARLQLTTDDRRPTTADSPGDEGRRSAKSSCGCCRP